MVIVTIKNTKDKIIYKFSLEWMYKQLCTEDYDEKKDRKEKQEKK